MAEILVTEVCARRLSAAGVFIFRKAADVATMR